MWKCNKCKETCEDTFDSCWNCGTGRDGSPPAEPFQESSQPTSGGKAQNKQPSNTEHQSNAIDFKKLSQFISAFGIIVLAVGGIVLALNQPKSFASSSPQRGQDPFAAIAQAVNDGDARLQVMDANTRAKMAREKAINILIAGGVILFIGIGLSASVTARF